MANIRYLTLMMSSVLSISACNNNTETTAEPTNTATVKNVILMIGDGMGAQQIGLLEEYARRATTSTYKINNQSTALTKFCPSWSIRAVIKCTLW